MLSPEIVHNHTVFAVVSRETTLKYIIGTNCHENSLFLTDHCQNQHVNARKNISDTILDFIKIPDNNVQPLVMSP